MCGGENTGIFEGETTDARARALGPLTSCDLPFTVPLEVAVAFVGEALAFASELAVGARSLDERFTGVAAALLPLVFRVRPDTVDLRG